MCSTSSGRAQSYHRCKNEKTRWPVREQESEGATVGRVKEVVLDCGHLVPMGKVGECTAAITHFLGIELDRWKQEREEFQTYWKGKSRQKKTTIDGK